MISDVALELDVPSVPKEVTPNLKRSRASTQHVHHMIFVRPSSNAQTSESLSPTCTDGEDMSMSAVGRLGGAFKRKRGGPRLFDGNVRGVPVRTRFH